MYLTDYYRFEHLSGSAKTRLDCTASTGGYDEFEMRRCRKATKTTKPGDLVIYCCDVPDTFKASAQRKADKSLTIGSNNVSSIYITDPDPKTGYGDFKGTTDALLFVFRGFNLLGLSIADGGVIEVYIGRGLRNNAKLLYNLLSDGGLTDEMAALKSAAHPENGGPALL